jgi:hypothetical protein
MVIQTHPAARISVDVQKKAMSQVTVGAVHNLPASLIVGAPHACPDSDSQSNDSQLYEHFRKQLKAAAKPGV